MGRKRQQRVGNEAEGQQRGTEANGIDAAIVEIEGSELCSSPGSGSHGPSSASITFQNQGDFNNPLSQARIFIK
ncbi:hypothetical protein TCAP_04586 [Tolypocladium capitatum]|uniref:Uncharacterized protein n=1 Tax=Tolypocladium capitatum TaxID=45235 RepID=A0A2K3QD63_9HYPO|nr:hypothetical protein TCAP_04586 [Tolypocladium capitatum]